MLIGFDASRAFVSQATGTENYSRQLLKALAKIDRKNQYRVYVQNTKYKIPNTKYWPENFEFRKIGLPRFWTQLGLASECLLKPPEVLFVPAHTLPVVRRPNLKTVVTIHDLGAEFLPAYHTFPQKFYLTASTKYAVSSASAIIAVSVATKNDLVAKLKADPEKIFVVPEGVDKTKFQISNTKFQIEKTLRKYKIKTPYILFVGTVQPRKNLVRLIEAFSKIIGYLKLEIGNLQLVIVGKLGWKYSEILAAPAKFKLANRVKFLNYVADDELPAIYQQAEVFVMPSLVEGFGLPVLEALAARVPVILSNRSSLPEVAGEAALYFNPENTTEMAEKISQVLENKRLRKEMIIKGQKQIEKFSWEKCAENTLKVLERVHYES